MSVNEGALSGQFTQGDIDIIMIKCMICDKELKQITRNHLLRHDISVAQYKIQFPNAPLQDESIILKADKNPFFGKKHTNEVKQRLSECFSGKPNVKAGEKISALWDDPNGTYRKMMASDSYRQTMSNVTQAYWDSEKSNAHRSLNKESLTKLRPLYENRLIEIRQSQPYRENLSVAIKTMWASLTPETKNNRISKQLTTVMKNGSMSSKGEDELFTLIEARYPNVKRFVWMHPSQTGSANLWNIDFFIPEIETYVQFDGEYWHGLDRPIEEIKESTTKRNKSIYRKWLLDQEQDCWFAKSRKRLIRITDVEFQKDRISCLRRIERND